MSEPVRCSGCKRPYNPKLPKCPFCNAPNPVAGAPEAGPAAPLDFTAIAATAIAAVRPLMRLEYHPAAVTALDLFFDQTWGAEGAAPDQEAWQVPPAKLNVILQFGAFFGELMRRELGGRWESDPRAQSDIVNLPLILLSGVKVNPIGRVFKRMKNGAGDALEPLYRQARLHSKVAPQAGELEGWKRYAQQFEGLGRVDLAQRFYARALELPLSPEQRAGLESAQRSALAAALQQPPGRQGASAPAPGRPAPPPAPRPAPPEPPALRALESLAAEAATLAGQARHDQALAAWQKVLVVSPAHAGATLGKARALAALGRAKEALAWLDELPFSQDTEPARSLMRGALAEQLGEPVAAEAAWRKALESSRLTADERAHATARAGALGRTAEVMLARAGEVPGLEEAVAAYQRVSAAHPGLAEPHREMGVGCAMLGRNDEALAAFDRAIALQPAEPASYDSKAVTLMRLERLDEAMRVLDEGLKRCPKSGVLHSRRGICVVLSGRPAEAVADFERSLAADPEYVDAWGYKGDAEAQAGKTQEAIASLERLMQLEHGSQHKGVVAARRQLWRLKNPGRTPDPQRAAQLADAAFAALRQGDAGASLRHFDAAVEADPTSGQHWYNRGATLAELKRIPEALAAFEQAEYWVDPMLSGLEEALALCLLHLGRPDEAVRVHDRWRRWEAKPSPAGQRARARTLVRVKRFAEALPLYEALVRREPRDVALVKERVEALQAAGQAAEAQQALEVARALAARG